MTTTMTSKGQVTIPKRLRDHLGLKPGSTVEFELDAEGNVVLKRAHRRSRSRFERYRGTLKGKMTTDEIMALLRGAD